MSSRVSILSNPIGVLSRTLHATARIHDVYCSMLLDLRLTFVRNHGDLAEGWYDPATLRKAQTSAAADDGTIPTVPSPPRRPSSPIRLDLKTRKRRTRTMQAATKTLSALLYPVKNSTTPHAKVRARTQAHPSPIPKT